MLHNAKVIKNGCHGRILYKIAVMKRGDVDLHIHIEFDFSEINIVEMEFVYHNINYKYGCHGNHITQILCNTAVMKR